MMMTKAKNYMGMAKQSGIYTRSYEKKSASPKAGLSCASKCMRVVNRSALTSSSPSITNLYINIAYHGAQGARVVVQEPNPPVLPFMIMYPHPNQRHPFQKVGRDVALRTGPVNA